MLVDAASFRLLGQVFGVGIPESTWLLVVVAWLANCCIWRVDFELVAGNLRLSVGFARCFRGCFVVLSRLTLLDLL